MTGKAAKDLVMRRRWIAVLLLLVGALLLLSPPLWEDSGDEIVLAFHPLTDEGSGVFDPFGLLPEGSGESKGNEPFGQMADMRVMRQALEIIGGSDPDRLSEEQLDSLAQLGIDRQTLEENSALLQNLIEAEQASVPKRSGWPVAATVCLLLAAVILAIPLLHRRKPPSSF
ncbi:MAG: hypothetical protein PUC47_05980 [Oscillospiraceae bacterium]|nr:hypothetical protein [Oscillospiraceae bacterium]